MSIKDQALRLIGSLPENCTWDDVFRAVSRGPTEGMRRPGVVRELRAPYGEEPEQPREEAGVSYDFDVIVERDAEGWYVGSVPALQGCHTQARSVEQLMERVREAVELCLEVSGGRPSETGFVGIRRVSVTA
ncbi:MAG TPA: type II toxin-antitoxin system HicB family antitoxin [Longimicrobium sp.]